MNDLVALILGYIGLTAFFGGLAAGAAWLTGMPIEASVILVLGTAIWWRLDRLPSR